LLEDRIARLKQLIAKRDQIDAELAQFLGVEAKKPRSRSRNPEGEDGTPPRPATE